MANSWPVPLNPAQEKNKSRISLPQILFICITDSQPLRFTPSLLSLRTSLRKHFGPPLLTHSLCPPCSIPAASRTQLLSGSRATTHGRPICHCRKACREIRYSFQNGGSQANKIQKYYKSGSTLDNRHFDHVMGWEMAHISGRRPFSHPK